MHRTCVPKSRVNVMFGVVGFRLGSRACCLASPEGRKICCGGNGPKNSAAPSGLIQGDGRQLEEGGPTRGACH